MHDENDQPEQLRQRLAQTNARIKANEARKQQQARKDDTRKKIITGALALHHLEHNPDGPFAQTLLLLLDEYVTNPKERALFGLLPLPDATAMSPPHDPVQN